MPQTHLYFYQDDDGTVPVRDWIAALGRGNRRAQAKCVARIRLLADLGHELLRPHADYLRDGIYELSARDGHVNYRILYFFHGRNVALLAHALTKEDTLPETDIERAIRRKAAFDKDPGRHTYEEDFPDA